MKNATYPLSYIFNRLLLLATLLLSASGVSLAQSFPVSIPWGSPVQVDLNGETILAPVITGHDYEYDLPHFSYRQRLRSASYTASWSQLATEPAPAADAQLIDKMHREIPSAPSVKTEISKDRNEYYLTVSVFPYYRANNQLLRIRSFSLQLSGGGPSAPVFAEKDYVSSSVLASGSWYKIDVPADGVYKIDRSFLESCGIDVETLDPQHLNIYGNASGRLSEQNNGLYFDDLAKNAIQVVGESDGAFDEGDYILFYGVGPNRWDYTTGIGFERNQHIYSSVNSYFIRVDATEPPLRITAAALSSQPATNTVTSYNYYTIHENESRNLVKGGQRWYGELFDGELSQDFQFSVPGLDLSSPLNVRIAVASNAPDTGSSFRFYLNGSQVYNQGLSPSGSGSFARNVGSFQATAGSPTLNFTVDLNREYPSVKGYLDFISFSCRRSLSAMGNFMQFRDMASAGPGNVSDFIIGSTSSSSVVWEVSDRRNPSLVNGSYNAGSYTFRAATDTVREFIVFSSTQQFPAPAFSGAVSNQNLHALDFADLIIVTPKEFLSQASRLASLHEADGTSSIVVTTEQVYNEYSSGVTDATAIRRFVKMFYDRAAGNTVQAPKHLLLFGDATYDPKNRLANNNYWVPTYEVLESENVVDAMATDDYFGLLDDNESSVSNQLMDIGVGRLLISSTATATEQVNKIEHYMKNGSSIYANGAGPNDCCNGNNGSTFGDWRNNYSIITDDEQGGVFVTVDAEPVYEEVLAGHPEMNSTKIYSDAYQQVSSAGGTRYPDVFEAITDRVQRGTLIMNYVGHGGETGAADERIITIPQIQGWTNIDKLALFVTATCEFTRFDDPSRVSAGEWVSLNATGGAIALMTTTRSILININSVIIQSFYSHVFERDANLMPLTFGEIMRRTKNTSGTSQNRRCFTLIGDPALKIALPRYHVVTDSINHLDPQIQIDTVKALSKMQVKGHIEDESGNLMTSFNGTLSPTIFDKPKVKQTLGNDPLSPVIDFETQSSALYKGRATVTNGSFGFEFIVPKDIDFSYGAGKISYYAQSSATDGTGYDTSFIIGGIDTSAAADAAGPTIDIFLNDDEFVNGGISSQTPVLIVDCFDEFGINTSGNGVGHDITAILDGNTSEPIVLNNYYTGNVDTYQSGRVTYEMRALEVGNHTLDVKVWDVNNNSSTARIEFTVVEDQEVKLDHVLNYPNPFTTKTTFFYEHNQSCSSLETQIQIYTVSGRLVKTINELVPTTGFRSEGIAWDGKDDFGDQLAKGVYVYRLSVELPDGGKAQKVEKLVLLR
jgi:hypothetical protein